jgi:hypothetical protein
MIDNRTIRIEFEHYLTLDQLNDLAREYATTAGRLVNIAVQRLIDDLEFARELRRGSVTPVRRQGERT